jgi:hypothetical protein
MGSGASLLRTYRNWVPTKAGWAVSPNLRQDLEASELAIAPDNLKLPLSRPLVPLRQPLTHVSSVGPDLRQVKC